MAAEVEEIVVDADTLDAEDLAQISASSSSVGVRGATNALSNSGRVRSGRRQCPAVDLAVGQQRQGIEQHEDRRDHVVGQLVLEKAAQLVGGGIGDHIRDQPLLSRRVLPGQDDGFSHGRMVLKRGFDFAQLDAEAADLHLVVGATEELDVPVGQITRQIAGLVQCVRQARC